ncbi:protein MAEA homolog isoform X3 [Malus sylvestris]|uniref:protein MAEA homolog isoform X3 n=1 Tax=Malus sylvestris TaxID=3752 RepID=UPI0021AC6510|nr:protein MAEA homolog isoform X3 [Malus sylvestris]
MEMDSLPNGTAASPGPTLGPAPTAAGPPPSSKLSHLADSLKLEHQFLRVPFEYYKKTIRANHRVVEKEISAVINGVSEAADKNDMSSDDAVNHLSSLVSRLQGLKRKLEEGSKTEHLQAQRCRARLDHLESADVESLSEWNNTRVNRILVDYMLRMSYYDTAVKLAESRNIQSKFEFQLRLQEFIELVRAENNFIAITYARKYLAPWGTTHMKELQRVFVTVAYKSTTECATYKVLFEPKQWDYLVDQFKQEFCKLYGMTLEPLLNIYLQAGLSALKTPYCYDDDCTKEDPLSQEGFRKLALPLPYSKQHHSKLVCYITKELMDTENPPQVLPNGYVYSSKALEEMARKNDGKITCPRTGLICNYTDLVKAYIS